MQTDERVGVLLGDLLDLDATLGREHEERLLCASVEGQREVVLARDVGGALDPEPPHDVAVDVHPEDRLGLRGGVRGVICELDPARLAAPAGEHLGLDDDLAADLLARPSAPRRPSARAGPPRRGFRSGRTAACPGTRRDPRRRTLAIGGALGSLTASHAQRDRPGERPDDGLLQGLPDLDEVERGKRTTVQHAHEHGVDGYPVALPLLADARARSGSRALGRRGRRTRPARGAAPAPSRLPRSCRSGPRAPTRSSVRARAWSSSRTPSPPGPLVVNTCADRLDRSSPPKVYSNPASPVTVRAARLKCAAKHARVRLAEVRRLRGPASRARDRPSAAGSSARSPGRPAGSPSSDRPAAASATPAQHNRAPAASASSADLRR